MTFKDSKSIVDAGFGGFKTVAEMKAGGYLNLPDAPGVYVIIRKNASAPNFLRVGTGGHFKGRDPNVSEEELRANWVTGTCVVYIGKATSLKKRLGQYMRFGNGANVGHWGGRFIWQLSDADQLVVCWKTTKEGPRVVEAGYIQEFVSQYGCRPFANLVD